MASSLLNLEFLICTPGIVPQNNPCRDRGRLIICRTQVKVNEHKLKKRCQHNSRSENMAHRNFFHKASNVFQSCITHENSAAPNFKFAPILHVLPKMLPWSQNIILPLIRGGGDISTLQQESLQLRYLDLVSNRLLEYREKRYPDDLHEYSRGQIQVYIISG